MTPTRLRTANPATLGALSDLCLRSKAHWGYDQAFLNARKSDLRVTKDTLRHPSAVTKTGPVFTGFVGLAPDGQDWHLDSLFVDPHHMGHGLGRALFDWACTQGRKMRLARLLICSDPFAAAFYTRLGATEIGSVASEPPAGRRLPLFEITL